LPSNVEPLLPHEMEHIRKVFDKDSAGKKHCAIATPREDAMMFRSTERRSVPCECIVELYELLWRWGHRNVENRSFEANFGFAIPDTVVIEKGKPYAWYFISRKDGALLRKSAESLTITAIEKKFCPERTDEEEAQAPIAAVWYPKASQFPEARCHSANVEFLTLTGCAIFLAGLRITHSGVLQTFVNPHGVSNFLIRTVQFRDRTSLCTRTNRALLARGRRNLFERAATFEGWEGLSSSSSRYRCHRHPHMEELMFAAGEMLSRRIEQERVRQMLFLPPDQHVALHFKVDADNRLFFIYASVVSETEVILQTRPQLLMGDACMTEELSGVALLPGGTTRKAPSFTRPSESTLRLQEEQEVPSDVLGPLPTIVDEPVRENSLPPIRQPARPHSGGSSARRRALSERRSAPDATLLPRMRCARPAVPPVPYRWQAHDAQDRGRYEYPPLQDGNLDVLKRPLVETFTSRSEPPLTARPPMAPRGESRPNSARRSRGGQTD